MDEIKSLYPVGEQFELLKSSTLKQISESFPFEGRKNTLRLKALHPPSMSSINDYAKQKQTKVMGRSWTTPIHADLELVDNKTGKVIDSAKKVRVANLPLQTSRRSYIINGNEYQLLNQWRLKSGAYSRIKDNGELETQFNLAEGRGFKVEFFPETRKFNLKIGTANVALLPVLEVLGVGKDTLEKLWGSEILAANSKAPKERELAKYHKALTGKEPEDLKEAIAGIREEIGKTVLREDTTLATLGKAFSKVNGEALQRSSKRLLGIARGSEEPDERDALYYKELLGIDDYIPLRIKNSVRRATRVISNNLDRKSKVREIVSSDVFNVPIMSLFTGGTGLAERPKQTNPLDMIAGAGKTTFMGWGGIGSSHAVTMDAKMVNNSMLGFVDPIISPDGEKTGISTYLTTGAVKGKNQIQTWAWDTKAKKKVVITPESLLGKTVAFPDQYLWDNRKPRKPVSSEVKTISNGSDAKLVAPKDVDYILTSSRAMLSIQSNIIPFLQNNNGNRANYGAKQTGQAISLVNREAPLVQSQTGDDDDPSNTFERAIGRMTSQRARGDGVVSSINKDRIVVTSKSGEKTEYSLYDKFPLNDGRSFIQSYPTVEKGSVVKKGQLLSDSNFTKDGVLAIGMNLRTAYLPFKSLNFEDGIVVSESTAKSMASEHMYQERLYADRNISLNKSKFRAYFPNELSDNVANAMDSEGVVSVGTKVAPGDTLVAAMRKVDPTREQLILRGIHKSLIRPFKDASLKWNGTSEGEVVEVIRSGREVKVFVKSVEPIEIGDKLSNRHGGKGVISAIVPDAEMPVDKKGEPMQILFNPLGVGGRINPGQILETALGKAAHKLGTPFAVRNFEPDSGKRIVQVDGHWRTIKGEDGTVKKIWIKAHNRGYTELVKDVLSSAGITDKETLYDPLTGNELSVPGTKGGVMVGYQYFTKLEHQSAKKLTARDQGPGNPYDADAAPKSGGKRAAMSMGEQGIYALLAHGTGPVENLREMYAVKSNRENSGFWSAYQAGETLPAPQTPFAYEKFEGYLKALGVNIKREGNLLRLLPSTDEEVKKLSKGELKNPSRLVRAKDLRPEPGGLFDEHITGGMGGRHWSHIKLPESLPNPMFEKPIRSLLGITGKDYELLIDGKKGVDAEGAIVPADEAKLLGGKAFEKLLGAIEVKKEYEATLKDLDTVSKSDLDKANKKARYLRALTIADKNPVEAYMRKLIPVLPPKFRPVGVLESGDLNVDDVNEIYKGVGILSEKFSSFDKDLPPEMLAPIRAELYDALSALAGLGSSGATDGPKGIMQIISGDTPKHGWFQEKMMKRRQDLSMRAVITPDKNLSIDQVGIPIKAAKRIFRPFVVRDMVRQGYTPLEAQKQIDDDTELAKHTLRKVATDRPIILKRDPVLHKFGVMAFKTQLVPGASMQIHPLVTGGYNADFDGDAMSAYVPVTEAAVQEARGLFPSKNLFNPASGEAMYQPSKEAQAGIFGISLWGNKTAKSYKAATEALSDAKQRKIAYTDVIKVGKLNTTAGRILLSSLLPEKLREKEFLTDPKWAMNKKETQAIMQRLGRELPNEYGETMDRLKDLGFDYSYKSGWTIGLDDMTSLGFIRDPVVKKVNDKVTAAKKRGVKGKALDDLRISLFEKADDDIKALATAHLDKTGNSFYRLSQAGVKPGWVQLKQMLVMPGLFQDAKNRTIPMPVIKSYGEGLDVSDYWNTANAVRKGTISKTVEVQEPGSLSKKMINTVSNIVITDDDCGTNKGIAVGLDLPEDVVDRFTASAVSLRGTTIPAGTAITPEVFAQMREAKLGKVHVRSPLRCKKGEGICATCFGTFRDGKIPKLRTNVGVIAGQAVGERATQLAMRVFHTGGAKEKGKNITDRVTRLHQILMLPDKLRGKATLSSVGGVISSVSKDPAGGFRVKVDSKSHYIPDGNDVLVAKGDTITKGQALSSGPIHPVELLDLTNVPTVQNYLTNALQEVYSGMGIRRRNYEMVVRGMTSLGKVKDSGDNPEYLRGDYVPVHKVTAWNNANPKKIPLKFDPLLKGLTTMPQALIEDWAARMNFTHLKGTMQQGAAEALTANIHSTHPVSALMYTKEIGKGDKPYVY